MFAGLMFLTFITTCIFQFRFAMALVRAQEEALDFKRLQLRWQGLMLLTFFTTHVFQFRFAELSIVGTPQPSIVSDVVFSSTFRIFLSPFTNQVLAQLESLAKTPRIYVPVD